ncbi:MAG: M91 family zinc metallopeptidase [Planctomycetaceae bacterium]
MQSFYGIRVDGSRRPTAVAAGAWSSERYELAIEHWLDRIMGTCTGKAVVGSLRKCQVTIVPDPEKGTPTAGPADRTLAATAAGTRKGTVVRGGRGEAHPALGTGRGTAVRIDFTPADFIDKGAHEKPDVVLMHELAHASRWNAGVVCSVGMLKFGFLTREEVHAVLVGNMYRSEQKLKVFRLSHRPKRYGTLSQAQATFALGKDLIRLLASRQPELYRRLRMIQTAFNPVRKFVQAR